MTGAAQRSAALTSQEVDNALRWRDAREVTPMAVERMSTGTNQVEVLDRVLDKGIVIDARLRVALAGIDLVGIDARMVVASLETYRKYEEVNLLERLLKV